METYCDVYKAINIMHALFETEKKLKDWGNQKPKLAQILWRT